MKRFGDDMPKDLAWLSEGHGAIANARVVTADAVVEGGVRWSDGRIDAIDEQAEERRDYLDFAGDYLLPGMVDIHTDNLEKHFAPRPKVTWDAVHAAVSHDAQIIAAGITTVFDSLCVGQSLRQVDRVEWLRPMLEGMAAARANGLLKADHRLHFRCEITDPATPDLFDDLATDFPVHFVSIMDHAPGHRQSPDVEKYVENMAAWAGNDKAVIASQVDALIERSRDVSPVIAREIAARARDRSLPLASHDDDRAAHVDFAAGLGAVMSEFPTTMVAAEAARDAGLMIAGGAPNLARGGSHSGNAAVADMARADALDVVCSDYLPASMLTGVFCLTAPDIGWDLPRAVASVSLGPAKAAGLDDRGAIAPGLSADMIRVRVIDSRPHVLAVWRAGVRVS